MDIIRAQEQSRDLHESFHNQLERSQDGFSVVADYFGRGVFNKVYYFHVSFLAHLSMKCSELAIVIVLCPLSVINFLACVRSRGHIFSPIAMKLGQNVCLEISNEFENGSCRVKN